MHDGRPRGREELVEEPMHVTEGLPTATGLRRLSRPLEGR